MNDAMSADCPRQSDPKHRAKIELLALGRALMPHQDNNTVRKVVAITLVGLWAVITMSLTLKPVPAVQPPYYGVLTAVVFLWVGRLWDIEVDRLLPTGGDSD